MIYFCVTSGNRALSGLARDFLCEDIRQESLHGPDPKARFELCYGQIKSPSCALLELIKRAHAQ